MLESEGLFEPVFVTDRMAAITSAGNWVQRMVDFECALAIAQGELGIIPRSASEEISHLSTSHGVDPTELGVSARSSATPVIALVRRLGDQLSPDARPWIHYGATSQDVLDSATMIVVRDSLRIVFQDLVRICDSLSVLAEEHRSTPMVARTLLQHALPTTFGAKAANWLEGVIAAGKSLHCIYKNDIVLQFGGAAGTLASLGESGVNVGQRVAVLLGLSYPVAPWHSQRVRIAQLGSSLTTVIGALGKLALDIVLGSQAEIAEFAVAQGGGSSALPQKMNPVGPIIINACFRRSQGLLPVLFGSMLAENERGAGEWPAEWETLRDMLQLAGTSAERAADTLRGLGVNESAMLRNLELTGGGVMSERVLLAMSKIVDRTLAQDLVRDATIRSTANQTSLVDELMKLDEFSANFDAEEVLEMFNPLAYLGSTQVFIDHAISLWRSVSESWKDVSND